MSWHMRPESVYYAFACLVSALLTAQLYLSFFATLAIFYVTLLACYDARDQWVLTRDGFASCLLLTLCIPKDNLGYALCLALALILILTALRTQICHFIGNIDVVLLGGCLSTLPPHCFQSFLIGTGLSMLVIHAITRQRRMPFIVPLWISYSGHLFFTLEPLG